MQSEDIAKRRASSIQNAWNKLKPDEHVSRGPTLREKGSPWKTLSRSSSRLVRGCCPAIGAVCGTCSTNHVKDRNNEGRRHETKTSNHVRSSHHRDHVGL